MKFSQAAMAVVVGFAGVAQANEGLMKTIEESHKYLESIGYYKQEDKPDSIFNQPVTCEDGTAVIAGEHFNCSNVDFLSFLSLNELEITAVDHGTVGVRSSDMWGWLSPTNREITLHVLDNGFAAVDTTDPLNPCVMAKMPTARGAFVWGDVKVHDNTVYHVKDRRGADPPETENVGIEVYDLLPLDEIDCHVADFQPPNVAPDFVYAGHGYSHNLAVNTESGLLFSVGSGQCDGGLVVLDINTDRLRPTFVACVDADGYTHDAQCLIYDGPDVDHLGKEICFAFNEDTVTIWDLSELTSPVLISKTGYLNQAYTHQGWATDDLTKLLVDDELDEWCNSGFASGRCTEEVIANLSGIRTTTTVVFDITDLDAPFYDGTFFHGDESIDHNLYMFGSMHRKGWGGNPPMTYHPDPNLAYLNNNLAGLRILDVSSSNVEEYTEVGFFDPSPNLMAVQFAGSWSGYLHPSGVYALSTRERGLFLLSPRMAFSEEFPQFPPPPTRSPAAGPAPSTDPISAPPTMTDSGTDDEDEVTNGILFVIVLFLAVIAMMMCYFTFKQ